MEELFGYFLSRETDTEYESRKRKAFSTWFVTNFPATEFEGEERLMHFLLAYATRLGVPLRRSYVDTFLESEGDSILFKEKIRVTGAETFNFDDPSQSSTIKKLTIEVMTDCYQSLIMQEANVDDFAASADAWMSKQLNEKLSKLYANASNITFATSGKSIGANDALQYVKFEADRLAEIYNREKLEELNSRDTESEEGTFTYVSDTGLPVLDNDMKGMYTSQLIGVEAAPGKGKTRFAVGVCAYRAAVLHKKNVLFFALEQTQAELEALFVSRHILTLFGKQIDNMSILTGRLPADLKEIVAIAKHDLFESGKYGKIRIEAKDLYLETFIEKMTLLDQLHGPFDMIIVDYMTLIGQEPREYQKALQDYQIASKAYKKFKKYVRKTSKLGIAINQLNRKGAEESENDKDTGTTSAAGGMETYRSTDYNIVITATKQMDAQQKRRIGTPKQRNSTGIGSAIVDVRLGCCYWFQNDKDVL